jgi:hypothetical protein
MHKIILLMLCCILYTANLQAQKHDNIWLFGDETYIGQPAASMFIDFNDSPATAQLHNRSLDYFRLSANICDRNGNLLFYTNGTRIADRTHQIMQNGDSINYPSDFFDYSYPRGYSSTESIIILPHPQDSNIYDIFHAATDDYAPWGGMTNKLYQTTVDMRLNNGLGAVVRKNYLVQTDTFNFGKLEAVKHQNGQDWWIIIPKAASNGFFRYLYTGDSTRTNPIQYAGFVHGFNEGGGTASFSPDGKWYARIEDCFERYLTFFNVNRCTGELYNPHYVPIADFDTDTLGGCGGAAIFSPSSRYLYAVMSTRILQFDMEAADILASVQEVGLNDGFIDTLTSSFSWVRFIHGQLAPDGKIYIDGGSNRYMHIIHAPDSAGLACRFEQRAIFLPAINGASWHMPTYVNYRTPAMPASACPILGVEELPQADKFSIFPNPAQQTLNIVLANPDNTGAKLFIFNALGQLVLTQEFGGNNTILAIADLPAGIYTCKVQLQNSTFASQFTVIK